MTDERMDMSMAESVLLTKQQQEEYRILQQKWANDKIFVVISKQQNTEMMKYGSSWTSS